MSNADSTSSEPPLERYDESVLSLCLTMDATGAILSINAVGAQQLGYGPSDLVGHHALDLISTTRRKRDGAHLRRGRCQAYRRALEPGRSNQDPRRCQWSE